MDAVAPIHDTGVGTTLPAVPDPAREARRQHARALRQQGLSLSQIAARLSVPVYTVQDDLRETPKPPPVSVRFPPDVLEDLKAEAAGDGVSVSQFVVDAVKEAIYRDQPEQEGEGQ